MADSFLIGSRVIPSRYCLAPLAGYTHLAFRQTLRALGGLGLATTDLVQSTMLLSERPKSLELIETAPDDRPLSVQIFGGKPGELVAAARWLVDRGYEGIDINMGCPMAKVTGSGGGARLMCDSDGACQLVGGVVDAVNVPVTVKMRLGWDQDHLTAPALAREFEQLGISAITIHGRTRAQGFGGSVDLEGIAATVDAIDAIPVIGNGDVRTVQDAIQMQNQTHCHAIAIGRGAMLDPWIFRKLADISEGREPQEPHPSEKIDFLRDHFTRMVQHRGDYACMLFRKFAAWYGAELGIPESLEDRLRRLESPLQFEDLLTEIAERQGERKSEVATALVRTPNGPIAHW